MAGWGALVQPVLLFMVSVENSLLSMGSQIWDQTKGNMNSLYSSASGNIKGLYSGAQNLASNSYEDVRRRAGSIYEDLHVKAEAKSKSVVEQIGNQIHLVYINAHLKVNLALNKLQLHFGLLLKDIKSRFRNIFKFNIGLKFKNLQDKTNVKVTKLKNKASEKVKDRFQNISLKAREYEDVLEEKLTLLSGSPAPRPLQEGRLTLRRNIPTPSTTPSPSEIDTEVNKVKIVINPTAGLFSSTSNVSGSSAFGSSPSTFSGRTINNNSYRKSQILLPLNKHNVKTRSPSLPDILDPPCSEIQLCSNCFAEDISDIGNIDKLKRKQINTNKNNSPEIHDCMWKSFSFVGPNPPDKFDCVNNDTELQKCPSNDELLHSKALSNKSVSNSSYFDDNNLYSTISPDMNTQNQQDGISFPNITSSHLNGIGVDLSDQLMKIIDNFGEEVGIVKCAKTDSVETTEVHLNSLSDSWKGKEGNVNIQHSKQEAIDNLSIINTNTNTVAEYSSNTHSNITETEDVQENALSIENKLSKIIHSYCSVIEDSPDDQSITQAVDEGSPSTKLAHNETCRTHLKHPETQEYSIAYLQLVNCKEDDREVNVQSTQLNTSSSTVDSLNPSHVDNLQTSEIRNDLSLSLGHYLVVIVTVYFLMSVIF